MRIKRPGFQTKRAGDYYAGMTVLLDLPAHLHQEHGRRGAGRQTSALYHAAG